MSSARVQVVSGVSHEVVADQVIVYVPGVGHESPRTAVQLSGDTADVFLRVVSGDEGVTVETEHVSELVAVGVLVSEGSNVLSRRSALKAGAVGVGVGITVLALPQAAAASSVPIELQGTWSFPGADSMLFEADMDGNNITGEPVLTVQGIDGVIPFEDIDDEEDLIIWERDFEDDGGLPPNLSGQLIGTFTSGGKHYRVTFEEDNGGPI